MRAAVALAVHLRRRERAESALPGVLAVLAFAVASAALLVTLGGVRAFQARAEAASDDTMAPTYLVLALVAAALLVVPVLTLGSVAARLVVARRDARLASLRLVGATSGQVVVVTLVEQALQAALGALLGAALYGVLLPVVALLSFQGRRLTVGELWVGPGQLVAVALAVVVLAVVSGVLGLARVVVSPLGVAERTTPGRVGAVRLLVAGAIVLAWTVGFQAIGMLGAGMLLAMLAAMVFTVDLVGPYFVMVAGRIVARMAQRPATLLAARRIVDDPRATWRSVSALGLGIGIAALSSVGALIAAASDGDAAGRQLGVDISTGSLVALTILSVVAATSTGVVQAARVYDQRPAYRALAFAGAPLSLLHRARLREVTIPLTVTIVLGAAFPLLILVPMAALIGPGLLVRMVVGVAAAFALLVAAVAASAPLVRRAATVG